MIKYECVKSRIIYVTFDSAEEEFSEPVESFIEVVKPVRIARSWVWFLNIIYNE